MSLAPLEVQENIPLGDATGGTGPDHLADIDTRLFYDPPHGGREVHVGRQRFFLRRRFFGLLFSGRSGLLLRRQHRFLRFGGSGLFSLGGLFLDLLILGGFFGWRGCRGVDGADHGPDRNRLAFSHADLQHAVRLGLHFQGDFIGFDDKQRLTFLDLVAVFL